MDRLKLFFLTAALFLLGMTAQATSARISTATVKVNGDVTLTLPSAYSSVLQYQATGVNYRWYSDNTSKATVSYSSYKTCTVRGKAEGTCRVYFYASFFIDGYYRTYDFYWDVTVSGYTGGGGTTIVDPVSISIHPASLTLDVGQSYNLTYDVYPANATYYNPEWVSYHEEIATVSSTGKVTATGPGTAYIYLWVDKKDGGNLVGTCEVTVKEPMLGDVDHDGDISVSDAKAIVDYILGQTPDNFNIKAADMNQDGKVSIADVTAVVSSILATNQPAHYLHVDVEELNFDSKGGTSQKITVDTDASYTITSSDPSWLTINQEGNTFTATATNNSTGSERNGIITIAMTGLVAGEKYEVEVPVKQARPSIGILEFDGGGMAVLVEGNGKSLSFNMVSVVGGTFEMGSTSSGSDASSGHSVTLSSFLMGETEVTQDLWYAVMGKSPTSGYNWDYTGVGDKYPAYWVSWDDCQEFIKALNAMFASCFDDNRQFRLPTEAEWEYAARGGNKSKGYKYSGSDDIGFVAWYSGNSGNTTHEVKKKQANELGLYDMTGNVYEWCYDWWGSYSGSAQTNPVGPNEGTYRVFRGGSYYDSERQITYRRGYSPDSHWSDFGFRLVLGAPLEELANPE